MSDQTHRGRQATGKATLEPRARRKGGKTIWAARGQIPIRLPDGTTGSRRIERGFGPACTTSREREKQCAAWNAEYEARFRDPRKRVSFARAYTIYLKKHKPLPYYGAEILEYIGETMCHEVDDGLMIELADELWPDDAAPATLNRHLYTPVIAIMRMALGKAAPELVRPAGHNRVMPVHIPPASWYTTLIPAGQPGRHLNPRQLALVMFLAGHGRRLGEALARKPKDLDVATGILDLGMTKTGVRQVELHPRSLALIQAIPGWDKQEWLFGAGRASANSIRRDLRAACVRAGLDWYHPHSFGRHSSVTRMLRRGYSVAHVADAHGMTPEMVTRRYGHLTRRETTAALHETGDELYSAVLPMADKHDTGGNVGDAPSEMVSENADKPLDLQDNSHANKPVE